MFVCLFFATHAIDIYTYSIYWRCFCLGFVFIEQCAAISSPVFSSLLSILSISLSGWSCCCVRVQWERRNKWVHSKISSTLFDLNDFPSFSLFLSLALSMVLWTNERSVSASPSPIDDHSSSTKVVAADWHSSLSLIFLFYFKHHLRILALYPLKYTHYPIFFGVSYLFQKTKNILFRCCSWYRRCFGGLFKRTRTALLLFSTVNTIIRIINTKRTSRHYQNDPFRTGQITLMRWDQPTTARYSSTFRSCFRIASESSVCSYFRRYPRQVSLDIRIGISHTLSSRFRKTSLW